MPTPRTLLFSCLAALLALSGVTGVAHANGDDTDLERHDPERLLGVVTKQQPVAPLDYAPDDLERVPGTDYELRAEVLEQLDLLFAAAEEEDLGLRVISGFRSYDTQAGLAVDLDNTTGTCYLDPCFGETKEGRWVAEHAHEFGFILSYPQGARERTGYAYEPWHLRYVGPAVAGDMHTRGIALLPDYLGAPASSVRIGELLGSLG